MSDPLSSSSTGDKTRTRRPVGAGKGRIRTTRDEYVILADYGKGWVEEERLPDWESARQALREKREFFPLCRFSYKRKQIKLQ